jgi:hypothetical protein
MAAHMIRYDRSYGSTLVICTACGRTLGLVLSHEKAQALGDRHRTQVHPRQAAFAASKRRARGTLTT